MLSVNKWVSTLFLVMVILGMSTTLGANVVELGESQLHGKKDQPETMTFVSPARLEVTESLAQWKPLDNIRKEISRDIFEVSLRK